MNLLGKVRRLHYRDGLNLSDIERRTGLTRKTIQRWLKAPEGVEPNYRRKRGDTKIGPFAERLIKMLETEARRPVRDRRTALKLFAELKGLGFDGDYSRVIEFIRHWREDGGAAVTKAFVPLQFEPGAEQVGQAGAIRTVLNGDRDGRSAPGYALRGFPIAHSNPLTGAMTIRIALHSLAPACVTGS